MANNTVAAAMHEARAKNFSIPKLPKFQID
jgi:hypothetical protein